MTGLVWGVLCFLGTFLFVALGDLVSEEIRGWLDLAPRAILRLAAARLDPELREIIYENEWVPELVYGLRGAEARPITRLIWGTKFAIGLLLAAPHIARCRTSAAVAPTGLTEMLPYRVRYTVDLRDGRQVEIYGPWITSKEEVPIPTDRDEIQNMLAERGYPQADPKRVAIQLSLR
jgi:hypothetical protein